MKLHCFYMRNFRIMIAFFGLLIWMLGVVSPYLPYKPQKGLESVYFKKFRSLFLRGKFFSTERLNAEKIVFYRTRSKETNWTKFSNPEAMAFNKFQSTASISELKKSRLIRFYKNQLQSETNTHLLINHLTIDGSSDSIQLLIAEKSGNVYSKVYDHKFLIR